MPKLSDLADMQIREVNAWIASVPHSLFYKKSLNLIVKELDYNEARRYLASLVILNEQNKSNLKTVSEENISKKLSSDLSAAMKKISDPKSSKKQSSLISSSFSSHNS